MPLITLAAVFVLIAVRRLGKLHLPIWAIMLGGALTVLLGGAITPGAAWAAVDWDVMAFLAGVFVIGHALETSGLLFRLGYRWVYRTRTTGALLALFLLGAGVASALLMNDTLAIIGTPLALLLARQHGLDPKLLLLTLAYGITVGSVASPIGNPQNLLVAMHGGLEAPFLTFGQYLLIPTLINMALTYAVLRVAYRREFHSVPLAHQAVSGGDPQLSRLAGLALGLFIGLIAFKTLAPALHWSGFTPHLSHIALVSALPLLLFSPRRRELVTGIDWQTLVFFAAMFVLMQSVWDTGMFQAWMQQMGLSLDHVPVILGLSVIVSQLISNVPMVALYLPLLQHAGADTAALMALAAGSTIAGNLFILGAASNIIIIQNAERRAGVTLSFAEFARVGVPLTILQTLIYALSLWWMGS